MQVVSCGRKRFMKVLFQSHKLIAFMILGLHALDALQEEGLQDIRALLLTGLRFAGSNTRGTWLQKAHGLGQQL